MKKVLLTVLATMLMIVPFFITAVSETSLAIEMTDNEYLPFELYVIDNDDTTATVVCSVLVDEEYSLIISKSGTKDSEQVTDGLPFFVDLEDEYAICFKLTNEEGILYYYDGYISVEMNSEIATLDIRDFILNIISDYDNAPEPMEIAADRYEIEPNDIYTQADRTYDDDNMYGRIYSTSSDIDWFKVSFSRSGSTNFWLGNIPLGCDYDLFLYASNGTTQLDSSRNGNNANELITYNVSANTDYYVKITSWSGSSSQYYTFRARNTTSTPTTYSINVSIAAGSDNMNRAEFYTSGSAIIESTNLTSGSDPALYNSSGSRIADDEAGNQHWRYSAVSGTHYYAGTYSNGAATYKITSTAPITLVRNGSSNPAYSINVTIAAGSNNTNRAEFYTTGAATIESTNLTSGSDPSLYNSSGTRIADDEAGNSHFRYSTSSGTYYYAGTYSNGAATYKITSTAPITLVRNGSTNPAYSINVTIAAGSNNTNRAEFYTTGAATVESTNLTSGSDPSLYNSSGTRIADDEAGNSHFRYTTSSGTYYYAGTYSNGAAAYKITSTAPITLVRNGSATPVTPGTATITSPTASGTTYAINNSYSYSYSASNATKYHVAVKIITGNPDPTSSNEAGYSVLENLNATAASQSFTISNSSTYAGLWVKLYVRGGNSASVYGDPAIKYVQIKPLTPTLNNPSLSGSTVSLSWSSASGAASYNLYRSTTATGAYSLVKNVTTTSTTDSPGTGTFYYKVAAVAKTTTSTDSRILSKGVTGDQSAYKSINVQVTTPTISSFTTNKTSYNVGETVQFSGSASNFSSWKIVWLQGSTEVALASIQNNTTISYSAAANNTAYTGAKLYVYPQTSGGGTAVTRTVSFSVTNVPSGDKYEPNNIMSTTGSTSIANNVTITDANIHAASDVDYYRFTLTSTSNVTVNLSNIPANCDYDLRLLDSAGGVKGSSAASGNNPESITVNNLASGTYYIYVYPWTGKANNYSSAYYRLALTSSTSYPSITLYTVPLYQQQTSNTCGSAGGRMILAHYGINISEQTFVNKATELAGSDDYTFVYVVKNTLNWFLENYHNSTRYKYVNVSSYTTQQYTNLVLNNILNSHPVEPQLKIAANNGDFPYSSAGHYVVIKGMQYFDTLTVNGYKAIINDSHPTYYDIYGVPIGNVFTYNKAHSSLIICVDE